MDTPVSPLILQRKAVSRVLVVARLTASSAELADEVFRRAANPCAFTLLVPAEPHGLHRLVDPEDHGTEEAERRLAHAVPLLARAGDSPVQGMVGSHNPLAAVQDALNMHGRLTAFSFPRRFPIVQFPNLRLIVAFLAGEAARVVSASEHPYATSISYLAQTIWAYEELVSGVNWFRHLLGFAYMVIMVVRVAHAVAHG